MRKVICAFPMMDTAGQNPVQFKNNLYMKISTPYNIYLLAAIIEKAGYEIDIKDWIGSGCDIERSAKELLEYDMVMFSCISSSWPPAAWVIEYLRKIRRDQIIIVGGLQASLFGEQIVEEFSVDYAVYGEGETSIVPLIEMIDKNGDPRRIPGLIYKDNGKIVKNDPAELLSPSELAGLPLPLYDRLPPDSYHRLSIESSRGCPNSCIFCAIPHHRSWRPLTPEAFIDKIIDHLPYLKKTKSGKFLLTDDNFSVNKARAVNIARAARKRGAEFGLTWYAEVPALQNSELLLEMAPFTYEFSVGAESFDPETIKKIGKNFKPEDIVAGALNAQKCGMSDKLLFSFIIGFPWQTRETIIEDINRIYDLQTSTGVKVLINRLVVSPGSRLWAEYVKQPVKLRTFSSQLGQARENINSLSKQDKVDIKLYIKALQLTSEKLMTELTF